MKANKEQIWVVSSGGKEQHFCRAEDAKQALKNVHDRLKEMSYEDFCAHVPLCAYLSPNQDSKTDYIQYYLIKEDIGCLDEDYDNDGWIYRKINDGGFQFWASFNHDLTVPYEQRTSLKKEIGADNVEEDYDFDHPDDVLSSQTELTPISKQEANRIMKKWRRLSKRIQAEA